MSITNSSRIAGPFPGTGAQVLFSFSFKVFTESDVLVVLESSAGVETEQVLTTNYSVSLNADQNQSPGGSVTMVTAPAIGENLTISSKVSETQPSVYRNLGSFNPRSVEDSFDRAAIIAQQQASKIKRAIQFPLSDGESLENVLPTATVRALKAIVFDANGNVTVSTDDYEDQAANAAASAAAALASQTAAAASETAAAASEASAAGYANNSLRAKTITYDSSDRVSTLTVGGKTYTYTYNADGTANTVTDGSVTATMVYTSGKLTSITVA